MNASGANRRRDRGRGGDPVLRRAAGAFRIAGAAALLLLLGVTVAEVVARYVIGDSLLGAEDLVTMCLTVVVAAGVVCAAHDGGHVSVNLIGRLGRGLTRKTDAVARLLGIAATAVTAIALFTKGRCGIECGRVTGTVAISHTPFYYALGAAMITCALLLAMGTKRASARQDRDDAEGPDR